MPDAIPIIIVTFRNIGDVLECLEALGTQNREPRYAVYLCENGGPEAFAALADALDAGDSPVESAQQLSPPGETGFRRVRSFTLRSGGMPVHVGEAPENLGYGGGINLWLRALLAGDWPGALILNPDAKPAPNALALLAAYAEERRVGMATGRIILADAPHLVQTRGLRWQTWRAVTEAVERHADSDAPVDAERIARMLDAPSGAAVYVRRDCIERIGLMEERYFLYYEDLDWGLRAKRSCGLGYVNDAVFIHQGGTTIGSGGTSEGSPFSAYLEARNALLFAREHKRAAYPWIVMVRFARIVRLLATGRVEKARAALAGFRHGLRGLSGRPDAFLAEHLARHRSSV